LLKNQFFSVISVEIIFSFPIKEQIKNDVMLPYIKVLFYI